MVMRLDASTSFTRKLPAAWDGHGIIADVCDSQDSRLTHYLKSCKKPIVSVRTDCPLKNVPKVIPDHVGAGREMAREFLNMGLNSFAFYTIAFDSEVVRQRFKGYEQEIRRAGKKVILLDFTKMMKDPILSVGLENSLAQQFKNLPLPIGVGTHNDYDSSFVCHAALQAGLKIPEQVAVVGMDNDPMTTQHGPIPLSSVDTNLDLVGYRAAALLDKLMMGRKSPRTTIAVPSGAVVRRRSTERFCASDPSVKKAMIFIDKNYTEKISVSSIVKTSGMNRRSFFSLFKKDLGITPKQVLLKKRLGHAKTLLVKENMKVHEVSAECGFNSNAAFIKFFKRETGCLPSDYRFTPKKS